MDGRGTIPESGRPDRLSKRASPVDARQESVQKVGEGIRHLRLGDLHLSADKYSNAQSYYERALDFLADSEDKELLIQTKIKIAECLSGRTELDRALEILQGARDDLGSDPDPILEGKILSREAKICVLRGDYPESLRLGFQAYEKLRSTSEHIELAHLEHTLGRVYNRLGQLEKAREAFEGALHTYRRIGHREGVVACLNNLGLLLKNTGRWRQALDFFSKALATSEELGHYKRVGYCALNLAILETKLGKWTDAETHLNRAMAIAKDINDTSSQAKIHLALGTLRRKMGLLSQAHYHYEEASRLATQFSYHRERLLAEECKADLLIEQDQLREADRILEAALEESRSVASQGDLVGELTHRLGRVKLESGQIRRAYELAMESAEICGGLEYAPDAGEALGLLAEILERSGATEPARKLYDSALSVLAAGPDILSRAVAEIRCARFLIESVRLFGSAGSEQDLRKGWQHLDSAFAVLESVEPCPKTLGLMGEIAYLEGKEGRLGSALERLSRAIASAQRIGRSDLAMTLEQTRSELEGDSAEKAVQKTPEFKAVAEWNLLLMGASGSERVGKVLEFALSNIRSDRGFLALHEAGKLKLEAVVGLRRSLAGEIATQVWNQIKPETERHICLATDLAHDPRFEQDKTNCFADTRSFAALRLGISPSQKGFLYLDRDYKNLIGPYGEPDLRILSLIGSLASMALAETIRQRSQTKKGEAESFETFITRSPEIRRSLNLLERIKSSNATVLLLGETGTGKGLMARCIHESSPRSRAPFLQVNCAALPESLLESELFGYVRGAFTGATNPRKGLFEEASGGTLFLDEVDKTTHTLQAKLLHVLDRQEVRPVGANKWIKVDSRVLCASNSDLRAAIEKREFLEDLYYRMNDFVITIPPLRERREDIPLLIEHFYQAAIEELGRSPRGISKEVYQLLVDAPWRGNVRELEKLMKRLVVLCEDGGVLTPDLLPTEFRREHVAISAEGLKGEVARVERRLIESCLRDTGWNKSEAARRLKISYPNLLKKIKILKILQS
jgi:transcriptional regulator with GAF, ATPase, and Fis domain/Tfp pilus assembly protein PilF